MRGEEWEARSLRGGGRIAPLAIGLFLTFSLLAPPSSAVDLGESPLAWPGRAIDLPSEPISAPAGYTGASSRGSAEDGAAIVDVLAAQIVPYLRRLDAHGWRPGPWMYGADS